MVKAIISVLVISFALLNTAMAEEFSADMILQSGAGNDSGKIYFKNQDVHRNEMMGMTIITKRPLVYQIFSSTKKYVVKDIKDVMKENPMADAKTFQEWLERNDMRVVGKETIQSFECSIYAGKVKFSEGQPPAPMRVWYSKKLDYPIKTETSLEQPMGKVSHYLENVKIGAQPAGLFEIPAGYAKAESVQEAMGMSGFQPPATAGPQGMPSQADRDKMMKEMQEMMKKMQKQ